MHYLNQLHSKQVARIDHAHHVITMSNNSDNKDETTHAVDSNVTPLVISAVGTLFAVLVLLTFFFIFWWHYIRPHGRRRNSTRTRTRHVSGGGVQEETLTKIPIVPYRSNHEESEEALSTECTICLGELEDGELLRVLPPCNHAFHVPCIDVWFMEHKNCPVCRSPIACDCDQSTAPFTDSQSVNIPSDRHHHNQLTDADDDVSGSSNSRCDLEWHLALHRHSHSASCHGKRKAGGLGMRLKRSLSMDQSSLYVVTMNIQRDYNQEEASASSQSSSTTNKGVIMSRYYKPRSLRHLDHMSKVLMRSFSQLRNTGSGRSCAILSTSV